MIRIVFLLFLSISAVYIGNVYHAEPACATDEDCPPPSDINKLPTDKACINFEDTSSEFTSQIVSCVENGIRSTVTEVMTAIELEMGWVFGTLCTIAITFLGLRFIGGDGSAKYEAMMLMLKIAFIGFFLNNLGLVSAVAFGLLEDLLVMVCGGSSPWGIIDSFMTKLFGFGNPEKLILINGLIGLVGSAAFSSTVGVMMFFTGVFAIVNVLLFIMNTVYIYLLAYLSIGFLVALSPVIIPLAVLGQTKRFFDKWISLILSAILTPVLLFAFLSMFAPMFMGFIQDIFNVLGGDDFRAYWRNNQPLFSWLMPSDPNVDDKLQGIAAKCGADTRIRPPSQLNINPFAKHSMDAAIGQTASLDFGPNDVNIVTQISLKFVTLWFFASFMKSAAEQIPNIASSIAGGNLGIKFGDSAVLSKVQKDVGGAESKLQSNAADDGSKFDNVKGMVGQIRGMIGKR